MESVQLWIEANQEQLTQAYAIGLTILGVVQRVWRWCKKDTSTAEQQVLTQALKSRLEDNQRNWVHVTGPMEINAGTCAVKLPRESLSELDEDAVTTLALTVDASAVYFFEDGDAEPVAPLLTGRQRKAIAKAAAERLERIKQNRQQAAMTRAIEAARKS